MSKREIKQFMFNSFQLKNNQSDPLLSLAYVRSVKW